MLRYNQPKPCRLSVAQCAALGSALPHELKAIVYSFGYKPWNDRITGEQVYYSVIKEAKGVKRKLDFDWASKELGFYSE